MKRFNTTGTCFPDEHYMVDITERLELIKTMIQRNDYFCINRGRQYGKTTTLNALENYLSGEYLVFSLSFEGISDESFRSLESVCAYVVSQLVMLIEFDAIKGLSAEDAKLIRECAEKYGNDVPSDKFTSLIAKVCRNNVKPVVLLIDEVDQASSYDAFLRFLGVLRNMYLQRNKFPTFKSVILAGVYDIKNLKLKIRPDDEHQYNSPWNIAVPFTEDMSLHADGIAGMLREYKNEHSVEFDENIVAQLVYDYTAGYPFLVSRLCQIIDEQKLTWDKEGVLKSVNIILKEANTLFDDIEKKVNQFPGLASMLRSIIFGGKRVAYNYYDRDINIASMFYFVKEEQGATVILCRIFETWLYNLFISNDKTSDIFQKGEYDKNQFIHDGYIDMRNLIERFSVHFNEIYRSGHDDEFVENNGRQIFLTYLRPIINGVGNYYCEAQTRDLTRTDIIVDYLGQQYVIELKIWHGESYNERGEKQLKEYLDYYHLKEGYMVSFCFNKNKQIGIHLVNVGDCQIVEAIV